ncbi:MAG: hypothetical protein IPG39_04945 [Bacteroidetes bacterium]|nr:hypothetical protein [Bacteroidota bacterium]
MPKVLSDGQADKLNKGTVKRYPGVMGWFPSLAWSPNISRQGLDTLTDKATMTYK